MDLIFAVTCCISKTEQYIYSHEIRHYRTTKYRVRFSSRSCSGTIFDTPAEAENELKSYQIRHYGLTGWVEPFEYIETVSLDHRYKRK